MAEITSFEIKKTDNQVFITSKDRNIRIFAINQNIFRITYTANASFLNKASKVAINQNRVEINLKEKSNCFIIDNGNISIEVDKRFASFSYFDKQGNLLVREPRKGGKWLTEFDVMRPKYDEKTVIEAISTADGIKSKISAGQLVFDRKAYKTKLEFVFGDEAIYGLGQHEEGILNYRGKSQLLYQQNMKLAVPMIVSSNHYAFLFDSMSFSGFVDNEKSSYFFTDCDDELDYYYIYGKNTDEIVFNYRELCGHVNLLPKWTYGFIQSKERYENQQELVDIVLEYRKRHVPLDCVVQDWCYWKGNYWGDKNVDLERYPNFASAIENIHAQNAKIMISIWPNMYNSGKNQKELNDSGFMLADKMVYNAYNEKAGDMYWNQAKKGLFDYGIDAWWCDSTEPYYADWQGHMELNSIDRMKLCVEEFEKFIDPSLINGYTLYHSENIYRNQRKVSDKRVVNLTRSYFPGQQRNGTIVWSGDISANWAVFKRQIADALNTTITGMPSWTYDIGAFFVSDRAQWFWKGDFDKGVEDLGFREFFVRMLEMATFLPMMRAHGTDTPREIWRFGQKGEMFYDAIEKFINLRYEILPYIYSLAYKETKGYTTLRSLLFDFSHDKNVLNIDDQFMFGDSFLVCPVVKPMYYDKNSVVIDIERTQKVYLPSNNNWYDFYTNKLYYGGQFISANAEIDKMPIFVKEGSIIPTQSFVEYSSQKPQYLKVKIYTGKDCTFDFYDDTGDGYDYLEGNYVSFKIEWNEEKRLVIIGKNNGRMSFLQDIIVEICNINSTKKINYIGNEILIKF